MKNEHLEKSKILGRGWQYIVYDLGNGRVYKRPNYWFESFRIIFLRKWKSFWGIPNLIWETFGLILEMRINARKSIQFLQGHNNLDKQLLGNYTIYDNLEIEQDKVTTIEDIFREANYIQSKKIIDNFVDLSKLLLDKYGFIDKAFKIGKNFGIDKSGKVILIDIGEIWFKKESINRQIRDRVWKRKGNLRNIPIKLRRYFVDKMDEAFLPKIK